MSDRGLILHLPLNGSLRDRSKYRNHAVRVGTDSALDWTNAPKGLGRAHYKSSTANTDYIQVPNLTAYQTNVFTVAFWVKIASFTGAYGYFVDKKGLDAFGIGHNSDKFMLNIQDQLDLSAQSVVMNKWTHVVVTRTGTAGKFYINGRVDSTPTVSATGNVNTNGIRVFASITGSYPQVGGLCDLRYYDRELSMSEVQRLYNLLAKDKSNV